MRFVTTSRPAAIVVVLPSAPFVCTKRSLFTMAAGTLGLWGMALVYVTWALRGRIGVKAARTLHLLAYPAFISATLHATWLGHGGVDPLYLLGSVAVCAALAVRLLLPPPCISRVSKRRVDEGGLHEPLAVFAPLWLVYRCWIVRELILVLELLLDNTRVREGRGR